MLRQIESLQATHAVQQKSWEDLERRFCIFMTHFAFFLLTVIICSLTYRAQEAEERAVLSAQNQRKAEATLHELVCLDIVVTLHFNQYFLTDCEGESTGSGAIQ